MPFTIAGSFTRLHSNLEITERPSFRRASKPFANGLTVIDDFLTGSYARSTMISPPFA